MATFRFDVDASEAHRLIGAVEKAISTASLMSFMEEKAHPWWVQAELERFAHEGDADGGGTGIFGGWSELSPTTVRIREALGYGGEGPINVRSGEMLEVLMNAHDVIGDASVVQMTIPGNSVDPITEEKIRTAQEGRSGNAIGGFGPTPPRPVLSLTEMNAEEILALLGLHLYEAIAGDFL